MPITTPAPVRTGSHSSADGTQPASAQTSARNASHTERRRSSVDPFLQPLTLSRRGSAADGAPGPVRRRSSVQSSGWNALTHSPSDSRRNSVVPLELSAARREAIQNALRVDCRVQGSTANNARNRPLTAVESEIAERYLLPDHVRAIGEAARIMNVAVSFREAGPETLKRLATGAIPKPASIKDNSIKARSLQRAYGDEGGEARLAEARALDLDGYVGQWAEEGGQLSGLYIFDPQTQRGGNPFDVIGVDDRDLVRGAGTFHAALEQGKIPVTGDGDMGDLLNLSGRRGPVPQGFEKPYIDAFNLAVGEVDPHRPYPDAHRGIVQHGPQHNFYAHLLNVDRQAPDPEKTRALLPVAMCDHGTWTIIKTVAELKAFYEKIGTTLKASWHSPAGTPTSSPATSRRPSVDHNVLPTPGFQFGTAGTSEPGVVWNTINPFAPIEE
ncbi:hypothetical protein [Cupriavidus plantarum]|uniref:hypothetical protein n=1 Tax=Cupriavidus plantarum TaxID=942865 RepID=UPI000F2611C4|nr:hypothetical protein [Cupriavidus plantarum]RLK45655.1 hypothetical protein C7417_1677 [Cupriavidus plantarum]